MSAAMTPFCRILVLAALVASPALLGSCRSAAGLVNSAYRAAAIAPSSATQQVGRFVGSAPGSVQSTVGRTIDTLNRTISYQSSGY